MITAAKYYDMLSKKRSFMAEHCNNNMSSYKQFSCNKNKQKAFLTLENNEFG